MITLWASGWLDTVTWLSVYLGMYSKIEKQVCVRSGLFGKDTVIELFLT